MPAPSAVLQPANHSFSQSIRKKQLKICPAVMAIILAKHLPADAAAVRVAVRESFL